MGARSSLRWRAAPAMHTSAAPRVRNDCDENSYLQPTVAFARVEGEEGASFPPQWRRQGAARAPGRVARAAIGAPRRPRPPRRPQCWRRGGEAADETSFGRQSSR